MAARRVGSSLGLAVRAVSAVGGASALLALACLALTPRIASAGQVSLSVGGGGFFPSNSLVSELRPDGLARLKSASGAAGTVQLTGWLGRRLGLEAQALYISAPLELEADIDGQESITFEDDGTRLVGGVHLLFAFYRPPLEPTALYASVGVIGMQHGGPFFDEPPLDEEPTSIGWALGLGARRGIARGLYLRLDARDFVTNYSPNDEYEERTQHDLVATIGLEWLLRR